MNTSSIESKIQRIDKVENIINTKIENLEQEIRILDQQMDTLRNDAIQKRMRGDIQSALQSARQMKQVERTRTSKYNLIMAYMTSLDKLSKKSQTLFLKQLPNSLVRSSGINMRNINNSNIDNSRIENFFDPQTPATATTTTTPRSGWCNAMGRCFKGMATRWTRKNKKEGGRRKMKGKSMKARRRH